MYGNKPWFIKTREGKLPIHFDADASKIADFVKAFWLSSLAEILWILDTSNGVVPGAIAFGVLAVCDGALCIACGGSAVSS